MAGAWCSAENGDGEDFYKVSMRRRFIYTKESKACLLAGGTPATCQRGRGEQERRMQVLPTPHHIQAQPIINVTDKPLNQAACSGAVSRSPLPSIAPEHLHNLCPLML